MFSSVGVAPSAGICAALVAAVSIIPTMIVHWQGRSWRPPIEE